MVPDHCRPLYQFHLPKLIHMQMVFSSGASLHDLTDYTLCTEPVSKYFLGLVAWRHDGRPPGAQRRDSLGPSCGVQGNRPALGAATGADLFPQVRSVAAGVILPPARQLLIPAAKQLRNAN